MGYGAKLRFKDEVAVGVGLDHQGLSLIHMKLSIGIHHLKLALHRSLDLQN